MTVKCFDICEKYNAPCNDHLCRYWINCSSELNCSMLVANKGPQTLDKIAEIMGTSKTAIGIIEKKAVKLFIKKLKEAGIDADLCF